MLTDHLMRDRQSAGFSQADLSPTERIAVSAETASPLDFATPELSGAETLERAFEVAIAFLKDLLHTHEQFTLSLMAEQSQFCRFNRAKVRQTGQVLDASLTLTWILGSRSSYCEFPLSGDWDDDRALILDCVANLRMDLEQIPDNPYLVKPEGDRRSHAVHPGQLLEPDQVIYQVLSQVTDLDFVGIYSAGWSVRAYADSVGQFHWFMSEAFSLDYSLFNPAGQAVKGIYAGAIWNPDAYQQNLARSVHQLHRLDRKAQRLDRGKYRTYLAPAAVAELIPMMSWGGVSEADLQQGGSWLLGMRQDDRRLSEKLSLIENFGRGTVPRFNDLGEVAPESLTIFNRGRLENTLISSRSAKEYGLVSNGAAQDEGLRAPEILPGTIASSAILAELDTGIYVSNLHYLNWSDRPQGRITGMTRYACFWVEHGELVAPIEHLRFDDSLYSFWGENLMGLTDTQECIPNVESYDRRSIDTRWNPGMLIEDFTYTL
jgi:predicted Zn-dependent protease